MSVPTDRQIPKAGIRGALESLDELAFATELDGVASDLGFAPGTNWRFDGEWHQGMPATSKDRGRVSYIGEWVTTASDIRYPRATIRTFRRGGQTRSWSGWGKICELMGREPSRPPRGLRREREREVWRRQVYGQLPERHPPYTAKLPRRGVVRILIARYRWPRRVVPALVLPPRELPLGYRWPVRHRRVELIDLATNLPPGYYHHGTAPWMADPWQWQAARRVWLRAFAILLIREWGAREVRIVGESDRSTFRARRSA